MKRIPVNKEQCDVIMQATCYVLDSNPDLEERLKAAGIDGKSLKKITKALDLINDVNQTYANIRKVCFKHTKSSRGKS